MYSFVLEISGRVLMTPQSQRCLEQFMKEQKETRELVSGAHWEADTGAALVKLGRGIKVAFEGGDPCRGMGGSCCIWEALDSFHVAQGEQGPEV